MDSTKLVQYMRETHNLLIGNAMAQYAITEVTSQLAAAEDRAAVLNAFTITVRGRSLVTMLPLGIEITAFELTEALAGRADWLKSGRLTKIVRHILRKLERFNW